MRWKALVAACAACVACAAVALAVVLPTQAVTAARATRISVSPESGGRSTTFTLRFTAPDRTGRFGILDRRYELTVSGPANRKRCVAQGYATLESSRAGAHVRAKLVPRRLGGVWCTGSFHGTIEEIGRPFCPPRMRCPDFARLHLAILIRTVGTFKFMVRPKAS